MNKKSFAKIRAFSTIAFLILNTISSFASFHEVTLQSTEAALTFSKENTFNVEGNYMYYLNPEWQLLFGAEYEKYNDTRAGLALGAVYNFGAADHNDKYYLKPQLNFVMIDSNGFSENGIFVSAVIGRRFPLYKGIYTLNYTPSIGVSIPVSNTDFFDPLVTVSIIGLSLVF